MSKQAVYLTDEQWAKIEPLMPKRRKNPKGGRPPVDERLAFEGILWILKTGARWKDMPEKYPHYSICWRRLKKWHEDGLLKQMWRAFLSELDEKGVLYWEEAFVDATFIPAKKGARRSDLPKGAREQSAWWWSMARVFLWEAIPTLPRQLRSGSSKQSSQTSRSRKKDQEDPGLDPNE